MSSRSTQTTQTCDRNSPDNAGLRKLRSSSAVCNLTKSWQAWVSESEGKQVSELCGWPPITPPCLGEAAVEPQQTWRSTMTVSLKTPYPCSSDQATTTAASQNLFQARPLENQKTSSACAQEQLSQDGSTVWPPHKTRTALTEEEVDGKSTAVPVVGFVKTKQVLFTGAQEKSVNNSRFLTGRIAEEPLSSSEEIHKMNTPSSPMQRAKSSNVSSPPTKSWKQEDKQQKPVEEDEPVEADRSLNTEAGQKDTTSSCIETEHNGTPKEDSKSEWVKRPSLPIYRSRHAEEANKINVLSKKYSAVGDLKSRWQNWSSEHTVNQKLNPFSEEFDYDYSMAQRLHKGQDGYGRPKEGSKTAERAKRAEQHIHREIGEMCYVIRTMKDPDKDGRTRVTFGELFDRYVRISDKVVGILMRARKHGKVAFEGEMLWQGRDDAVIITLLV